MGRLLKVIQCFIDPSVYLSLRRPSLLFFHLSIHPSYNFQKYCCTNIVSNNDHTWMHMFHVTCLWLARPGQVWLLICLSGADACTCQSKEKHELADSSGRLPRLPVPCNTKCTMSHVPKMKQKHSSEWKSAILKWKILTVHRLRVLVQVSRYPNLHFKTGLHSSVTPWYPVWGS